MVGVILISRAAFAQAILQGPTDQSLQLTTQSNQSLYLLPNGTGGIFIGQGQTGNITLSGAAPASSSGATGTNAPSPLVVSGVTGGADSMIPALLAQAVVHRLRLGAAATGQA